MKAQPRSLRRFHVPKGVAYAVGNSRLGIWFAVALGFRWIDLDLHVTRDGVIVCGHWSMIRRDKFVLPDWFVAKYGRDARIEQVDWPDLMQLHTVRLGWRGRYRRLVYITAEQAMRTIARRSKRLGIAGETKDSAAFARAATWQRFEAARARAGLPAERVVIMRLSTMMHPYPLSVLRAAKLSGRTTLLLIRGPIPRTWDQWVDYYSGHLTR